MLIFETDDSSYEPETNHNNRKKLFASLLSCISIMHNICFFQQSNEQLGWCDWMESVCALNKEKGWWAKAVVAR